MKFNICKYHPCYEAIDYYRSKASFKDAWNDCQRGDWMLWISQRLGVDVRLLTKAKALCAKTVEHLMMNQRSKVAVQAALDFADGKIDRKELYAAYTDAVGAADAAAYTAAADADADAAADAAADAVDAAYAAAYAAAADAVDADADAAAYARLANQKQTADICRKGLTDAVFGIVGEE